MKNTIEIVLVLYNCTLEESVTYTRLQNQLKKIKLDYELIIYNNDKNYNIDISDFLVINSVENNKLAGAYNFALDKAVTNDKKWLLLLDQDTEIPENYFDTLQNFLLSNYPSDLVAVVPILKHNDKVLSPKIIDPFIWKIHDIKNKGYFKSQRIIAFNSMTLLKVEFMKSIDGFCTDFPLDMLDVWYFNKIYTNKKVVYVLDIEINHNLSVANYEENISISRHIDFMKAESLFVKELSLTHYLSFKIKLISRSFKQFIKYKNKKYAFLTLRFFFK